jgi:error-prone DNA polymerase
MALADLGGVYGIPRFVKAARAAGIRPLLGATVPLDLGDMLSAGGGGPATGSGGTGAPRLAAGTDGSGRSAGLTTPDSSPSRARPTPTLLGGSPVRPDQAATLPPTSPGAGRPRLLLLCRDRDGWANLCELLTEAHRGREKGDCLATQEHLERFSGGLIAVAGGLDGPVIAAARAAGREAARDVADRLAGTFGRRNVALDLQRHGRRDEEHANRLLHDLASSLGLACIATNDTRYATPDRAPVLDVLLALRHHVSLDSAGRLLPADRLRHLPSAADMTERFADLPGVLAATTSLAARLDFTLADPGYTFPRFPTPSGETEFSLLHELVQQGVRDRYRPVTPRVMHQVTHELDLIQKLDLAGYFLLVHDIARFCRDSGILAQGRGSAANSAVCYSLGITAVDPIAFDLLFERFLSEERGEWPDIDLDLPSGDDREKVIQYVYGRYGERSVGMAAAVNTYHGRGAARDIGKVLGLDPERIGRLAGLVGHFEFPEDPAERISRIKEAGLDVADTRVRNFLELWGAVRHLPRHLSQHNGGMVICGGRLDRVVPLEPAAMPGRVCVQWDKDDLCDQRIIKVDLLGLGMLAVLRETIELVRHAEHVDVDLAHLPPDDPGTYEMLRRADTVGVFQVESRAQMATLPRLKPRRFYDLVVEVALIRPGPIVGKMVHPYLARRAGRMPVTYDDPCLEPILARTLGIPLFQEQLMRMAMTVAGFTGGQAEELRRALGSRRSKEQMERMVVQMREGMTARGIAPDAQDRIVESIASFALYGFPESHSASFALIAYASAYLKHHHPAAFLAALLDQWPMGFYHPSTLVRDAVRHGVEVRPVDANLSAWDCTLESGGDYEGATARPERPAAKGPAVRLGLKYIKGLSQRTGKRIVQERDSGPFLGVTDLGRRTDATSAELFGLAEAGALGTDRRNAMWQALALPATKDLLAGTIREEPEPALPVLEDRDAMAADFARTGITTGAHPVAFLRAGLNRTGALRSADLPSVPDGRRVRVAGMVIVRQRPYTAKGMFFATLEDETGLSNLVVTPDLFIANRRLLSVEPFILVEGVAQNREGVTSIRAERFRALSGGPPHEGRNFC